MAEARIHRLSIAVLLVTFATGIAFAARTETELWPVVVGSGAIALAQLITVPAPSDSSSGSPSRWLFHCSQAR